MEETLGTGGTETHVYQIQIESRDMVTDPENFQVTNDVRTVQEILPELWSGTLLLREIVYDQTLFRDGRQIHPGKTPRELLIIVVEIIPVGYRVNPTCHHQDLQPQRQIADLPSMQRSYLQSTLSDKS